MINIKELNFSYGKKEVLSSISLNLQPGRIYGLLGENGVGKSTLLKLMCGLLAPKGGSCTINGFNPYKREPEFLSNIYYLAEDFVGAAISVESYALNIGKFYPKFSKEKFYRIANDLNVDIKSKYTKLSFGQQKKGIISLALALNTDILLMDEPSNGLDIPSKIILRRIIAENISDNQIIIISTHQIKDLENLIDPIIILNNKETLLNASINDISARLTFSIEQQKDAYALYSEQTLNGYMTVRLNKEQIETQVDIEALFNCVLANKELIKGLFGNGENKVNNKF